MENLGDLLKATEYDDFDTYHINVVKQHCRFLLFTGLRSQEAGSMKWKNVNFRDGTITIPNTKNGKSHILPLGKRMLEFLKEIKEHQFPKSEYVFPSNSKTAHLMNGSNELEKLRELSGISFSYHDLRRTFASIVKHSIETRYSPETIKRLLNHTYDKKDVTSRYIVFSVEDLRKPIQEVEDYIFS